MGLVISVNVGRTTNGEKQRQKGKSLLEFPPDYTVIDLETTGLDPKWDRIIELSAIRVRGGQAVDEYSTLVNPECEIDEFITELTGITNEAVADAPKIADILPSFRSFVGTDIIVGHNVNFDINFVYDYSEEFGYPTFSNDFLDTLRISRRVLPDLPHHRLADVAEALNVKPDGAHRGLADCRTTLGVFTSLQAEVEAKGIDLRTTYYKGLHASDIVAADGKQVPDHLLFGKVCVFTGTLENMTRREAMQAVADIGGICADGVTAKTNFLILGNLDYSQNIKNGKSAKLKKAEAMIIKGKDLQILSESVFYDLLQEQ